MVVEKLSNLQLELLKLYQYNIEDNQLLDIKRILAKYFAAQATSEFDKLWEENKWSDETMEEWLKDD